MSTVREPSHPENPDGGDEPLMSLKALVLLLVSSGAGLMLYVVTGDAVGGLTVAIALLLALAKLIR